MTIGFGRQGHSADHHELVPAATAGLPYEMALEKMSNGPAASTRKFERAREFLVGQNTREMTIDEIRSEQKEYAKSCQLAGVAGFDIIGPAAVTKQIGDRIIALTQMLDDFWGKPCVIIATAGNHGWEGYTLSALINTARCIGLAVKDASMFMGALPGETLLAAGARERVRLLGSRLFGEARPAAEGEYPTCWSELWKFPKPGSALCTLCGQTANLVAGEGGVQWVFGPQSDRYKQEELNHHNQDLRSKVKEYLSRRNDLAVVRNAYKGEDNWLKPEGN